MKIHIFEQGNKLGNSLIINLSVDHKREATKLIQSSEYINNTTSQGASEPPIIPNTQSSNSSTPSNSHTPNNPTNQQSSASYHMQYNNQPPSNGQQPQPNNQQPSYNAPTYSNLSNDQARREISADLSSYWCHSSWLWSYQEPQPDLWPGNNQPRRN